MDVPRRNELVLKADHARTERLAREQARILQLRELNRKKYDIPSSKSQLSAQSKMPPPQNSIHRNVSKTTNTSKPSLGTITSSNRQTLTATCFSIAANRQSIAPNQSLVAAKRQSLAPKQALIGSNRPSLASNHSIAADQPASAHLSLAPNPSVAHNRQSLAPNRSSVAANRLSLAPNPSVASNKKTLAPNRPSVPTNRSSLAPNRLLVPSNRQSLAPNHPSVPSNRQSLAPNRPSVPSNRQSLAPNRPSVPSNRQSLAPNYPSVPSNRQSLAPNYPSLAADRPLSASARLSLAPNRPSVASARPMSESDKYRAIKRLSSAAASNRQSIANGAMTFKRPTNPPITNKKPGNPSLQKSTTSNISCSKTKLTQNPSNINYIKKNKLPFHSERSTRSQKSVQKSSTSEESVFSRLYNDALSKHKPKPAPKPMPAKPKIKRSLSAIHWKKMDKSLAYLCYKNYNSVGDLRKECEGVELQKKLYAWLEQNGKPLSHHHLQCFGIQNYTEDEEDKENIPHDLVDGESYTENLADRAQDFVQIKQEHDFSQTDEEQDATNQDQEKALTHQEQNESHKVQEFCYEEQESTNYLTFAKPVPAWRRVSSISEEPESPMQSPFKLETSLSNLHTIIKQGHNREDCMAWLRHLRAMYPHCTDTQVYWECCAALTDGDDSQTNSQVPSPSMDQLLNVFNRLQLSAPSPMMHHSTRIKLHTLTPRRNDPVTVLTPVRRSVRVSTRDVTPRIPTSDATSPLDDVTTTVFRPNKALLFSP